MCQYRVSHAACLGMRLNACCWLRPSTMQLHCACQQLHLQVVSTRDPCIRHAATHPPACKLLQQQQRHCHLARRSSALLGAQQYDLRQQEQQRMHCRRHCTPACLLTTGTAQNAHSAVHVHILCPSFAQQASATARTPVSVRRGFSCGCAYACAVSNYAISTAGFIVVVEAGYVDMCGTQPLLCLAAAWDITAAVAQQAV